VTLPRYVHVISLFGGLEFCAIAYHASFPYS
jgi:hypothetical protein